MLSEGNADWDLGCRKRSPRRDLITIWKYLRGCFTGQKDTRIHHCGGSTAYSRAFFGLQLSISNNAEIYDVVTSLAVWGIYLAVLFKGLLLRVGFIRILWSFQVETSFPSFYSWLHPEQRNPKPNQATFVKFSLWEKHPACFKWPWKTAVVGLRWWKKKTISLGWQHGFFIFLKLPAG